MQLMSIGFPATLIPNLGVSSRLDLPASSPFLPRFALQVADWWNGTDDGALLPVPRASRARLEGARVLLLQVPASLWGPHSNSQ